MDSETDSEILADADWLIDSDSEVEIDSLVETEYQPSAVSPFKVTSFSRFILFLSLEEKSKYSLIISLTWSPSSFSVTVCLNSVIYVSAFHDLSWS